jgi:polar amino acid transport system substrate-binding protein
VMRVGVTEADPWVELGPDGRPTGGVEVELARRFARDLGARVAWVDGGEEELVNAMKEGSLDVLIGGLTDKSRWEKDVALTRPYLETRSVVGVPAGRSASDELDGMRVMAELGTEEEALLDRKTSAEVTPVTDLAAASERAAAVPDYLLDDLHLRETNIELKKEKHVMAVRPGENAFLVRLERFLLNREEEIDRLLLREGKP